MPKPTKSASAAMEGVRPVIRETLRDRVYEGLRKSILTGALAPGEAMTVRALAQGFGVSPTPVREALQQLVAESALLAEPNRSYRVPEMSLANFLEIRDMRAALEGLAAERAAGFIRPGQLRRLEWATERMQKAIAGQQRNAYLAANQNFHFTIYAAANAPILLRTIRALWLQIGPSLNMLFSDIELVAGLQDNHRAALRAFHEGDGAAARQAIRADILQSGEHISREIRGAPGGRPADGEAVT